MKIGILTFHCAYNYGAVLQAYALQEYLKTLGHEVHIIDYRPAYLLSSYKICAFKWNSDCSLKHNIFLLIRSLLILPTRIKRSLNFKCFLKKHLSLYPVKYLSMNSDFDAFITGSDQIWNPLITGGRYDDFYWGKLNVGSGKKVISYAASAGTINNLESNPEFLRKMLSAYSSISVREKSLADYIEEKTGYKPYVVVDPVLLCDKNVFTSIMDKQKESVSYLLIFQLKYNDDCQKISNIATKIAKQKGISVIRKLAPMSESLKDRDLLTNVRPETFLSLIAGASYVVTSSFHGTVFSLLFEKNFSTVKLSSQVSERMENLLDSVGLNSRLVDDVEDISYEDIDYNIVNKHINKLRSYSRNFLKAALE